MDVEDSQPKTGSKATTVKLKDEESGGGGGGQQEPEPEPISDVSASARELEDISGMARTGARASARAQPAVVNPLPVRLCFLLSLSLLPRLHTTHYPTSIKEQPGKPARASTLSRVVRSEWLIVSWEQWERGVGREGI